MLQTADSVWLTAGCHSVSRHADRPVLAVETVKHEVFEVGQKGRAADRAVHRGERSLQHRRPPFSKDGPRWWRHLAAGCHDLDTAGGQDWVLAKWQWGARFAKRELLLASVGAQMYGSSEIAASMVSRIVISVVMRGALTLSDGPDPPDSPHPVTGCWPSSATLAAGTLLLTHSPARRKQECQLTQHALSGRIPGKHETNPGWQV